MLQRDPFGQCEGLVENGHLLVTRPAVTEVMMVGKGEGVEERLSNALKRHASGDRKNNTPEAAATSLDLTPRKQHRHHCNCLVLHSFLCYRDAQRPLFNLLVFPSIAIKLPQAKHVTYQRVWRFPTRSCDQLYIRKRRNTVAKRKTK